MTSKKRLYTALLLSLGIHGTLIFLLLRMPMEFSQGGGSLARPPILKPEGDLLGEALEDLRFMPAQPLLSLTPEQEEVLSGMAAVPLPVLNPRADALFQEMKPPESNIVEKRGELPPLTGWNDEEIFASGAGELPAIGRDQDKLGVQLMAPGHEEIEKGESLAAAFELHLEQPLSLFPVTKPKAVRLSGKSPLSLHPLMDSMVDIQGPPPGMLEQWENQFQVKIAWAKDPEEKGTLFSVKLVPQKAITPLPAHVVFLIDASKATDHYRYANFKRAVQRSLRCLGDGQYFSIVMVGKKARRLAIEPLLNTPAARKKAEEFLERVEQDEGLTPREFFALVTSLQGDPQSANIGVYISDGHWKGKEDLRRALREYVMGKKGDFILYTASVGKGAAMMPMELIAQLGGGEMICSDTYAAFPRRLGKMLLNHRTPLLTDLVVTVSTEGDMEIPPFQQGAFFAEKPLSIVGRAAQLKPLVLTIQGRRGENWVEIRRQIRWEGAEAGGRALQEEWARAHGSADYLAFVKSGKEADLKKVSHPLITKK